MKNRNLLVFSIFLLTGWGAAAGQARGALLKPIQDTFLVSKSVLGLTAPVIMLGFMVSVLTIGMIMGRINIRKFLLIGAGLSFISLILLGSSPFFFLLLGFFFVSGILGRINHSIGPTNS